MEKKWRLTSLKDLDLVVRELAIDLKKTNIVFVKGTLGSGKTTFVNHFVKLKNGSGSNSPTFAIHNTYDCDDLRIHHLDLYRLEDEEDILSVGLDDIFADEDSLIFIEWPERLLAGQIPRGRELFELQISMIENQEDTYRDFHWRKL